MGVVFSEPGAAAIIAGVGWAQQLQGYHKIPVQIGNKISP